MGRTRITARGAVTGLLLGALVTVGLIGLWPARLGGSTTYVSTHGISMAPRFSTGDLAVLRVSDHYGVGDVVAYHSQALRTVVMHRVVAVDHGQYTFKGDHNSWLDPDRPTGSQLIGKLEARIPRGGVWLGRLTSPAGLTVTALGLAAAAGSTTSTRRRRRRGAMSRHAIRGIGPGASITATVVAALGLLGLGLGAAAWMAPLGTATRASTEASRQMTFSYTAVVPRSPAYDGTTVHSPEPVFRRLSNTVELQLAYQGASDRVSVTAEVSNPTGWHSSIPLAARAGSTADPYRSTVGLDLSAVDRRAAAAAAVTGLPAGPVSIAITAHILTAGQPAFAPTLTLNLTPLELSLAGDPGSLSVQDATVSAHAVYTSRTLSLLGAHITVARARSGSVTLLLGALIAAAVLGLLARGRAPATEGATIRRRYAPLLASVGPITTPPGRPVIEVTQFETLATLAQRCGQLVLHWSRTGVDTFIVLDEGTTYRYRAGSGDGALPESADLPAPARTTEYHAHPDQDSP